MITFVRRRTLRELREASPLTGLPGNTRVCREITRRITNGMPLAVCYVDIDRFKSVNDSYGFVRGDELILFVAQLLRKFRGKAFLGHLGGDDFVVICAPEAVAPLFAEVTSAFEREAPRFYDPADAQRGHITSIDRQGHEQQWEIVTLSIGVATAEHRVFHDAVEIVAVAAEMKNVAKSLPGTQVCVDRRRG
ncbi:MAG: GGDEF domain-containing protein [Longispora sp.]|nr:GGDEF domain-containing protein [Longispora sp. (in: high G+C Gram-positive bacteria)]